MIMIAIRNMKIDILLIPCIYLIQEELGDLGSRLRMYKYSDNCFKTPIVQS